MIIISAEKRKTIDINKDQIKLEYYYNSANENVNRNGRNKVEYTHIRDAFAIKSSWKIDFTALNS